MLAILTIASIAIYLCCIGYGYGHIALNTLNQSAEMLSPKPSYLSITYQRQYCNTTDFLQLEIDTTYREIGKAHYRHEVICDRTISLTNCNSTENSLQEKFAECFISSDSRNWLSNNTQREILGYSCHYAAAIDGSSIWESWYCDALPYVAPNARVTDGLQGLILEVRNTEKHYTLKAVNICQTI